MKKGDTKVSIAVLQEQVKEMRENHLPHIQKGLDSLTEDVQGIKEKLAMLNGKNVVIAAGFYIAVEFAIKWILR